MNCADTDSRACRERISLVLLLALVNLPALVLVGHSGVSVTSWSVIAGVASGLGVATTVLLYVRVRQGNDRLRRVLAECREQREHLDTVVETVACGVLILDNRGRVTQVNAAARKLFGLPTADLLDRTLHQLFPGCEALSTPETNEHRVIGAATPIYLHRRDGSSIPIELATSKTRRENQTLYTVILHDLTEAYRLRKAAKAASEAKSSFLIHMSHEVRTPLNGILGMAQMLQASNVDEEQRQHLAVLQHSVKQLLDLFDRVLELTQLDAGELHANRERFSLREVLNATVAAVEETAQDRGVRVRLEVVHHTPDQLMGDPARLGQVLTHLLDNAVKFAKRGKVGLRVETLVGRLIIEVRDAGPGIAPEKLARIFEPFEQSDGSSTRRHAGAGLGLTLASRLARLMGGEITVSSTPGKGSTFRVILPLEVASRSKATEAARPILIAIPDLKKRGLVEEVVRRAGMTPVSTGTGKSALTEYLQAILVDRPFMALVLEDGLPDLSTEVLLQQLADRSDSPCLTILFSDDAASAARQGELVSTVIPRHATSGQLRDALARVLNAPQGLAIG